VGSNGLAGEVLERSAVGHGGNAANTARRGRDHANGSLKALPFPRCQRVAGQLADGGVVRGRGTELLEETVVSMLGGDRQKALVLHVTSGSQFQSDNGAIGKALQQEAVACAQDVGVRDRPGRKDGRRRQGVTAFDENVAQHTSEKHLGEDDVRHFLADETEKLLVANTVDAVRELDGEIAAVKGLSDG
jgi:hypothetical protein